MSFLHLILAASLLAGIVKLPSAKEKPVVTAAPTYEQLVCTSEDRENIQYIFTTMAESGLVSLFVNHKSELTRRGQEISHVHPLKLLGVLFSDPNLKECMKKIYSEGSDSIKFSRFLKNIKEGLSSRMDRGLMLPYVEDFAKEVSVPSEPIKNYVLSRDWDGLIEYLLTH